MTEIMPFPETIVKLSYWKLPENGTFFVYAAFRVV